MMQSMEQVLVHLHFLFIRFTLTAGLFAAVTYCIKNQFCSPVLFISKTIKHEKNHPSFFYSIGPFDSL